MGPDKVDNQGKAAGGIPRGIEILVKKASVDPAFRAILLERRAKAADEIGLELTPAEVTMLDSIPAGQLKAIIDRTKVDPSQRNAFLGKVALVMLAAVGAAVVIGPAFSSLGHRVQGVRPDLPTTTAATAPAQPGTGPATETPRKDGP